MGKYLTRWMTTISYLLVGISPLMMVSKSWGQDPSSTSPTIPAQPSICRSQLSNVISSITQKAEFSRYRWGILVETLNQRNIIYSQDADQFFLPASNVKLLTTAAILTAFGENYRFRTSVYKNNQSFFLVGGGDPTITEKELNSLANQLRSQGYNNISQLIGVDNYFKGNPTHADWEWGDLTSDYAVSVNSLIFRQNAIDLTLTPSKIGQPPIASWSNNHSGWQVNNQAITDNNNIPNNLTANAVFGKPILNITGKLPANSSPYKFNLAVIDPATYTVNNFRQILSRQGIKVGSFSINNNPLPVSINEVASILSPTIADLIKETNQNSNNLYAEVLLRQLSTLNPTEINTTNLSDSNNSLNAGLTRLNQQLTNIGLDNNSYRLTDGSGLSRHNLITPKTLVQILQIMANQPNYKTYRDSLPIAGINGSLKNRFTNTPALGRVQAKTGTLSGVVSLSGYLEPIDYQPLAFSIIVNNSDISASKMRQTVDEIVIKLTQLKEC